MKGIHTAFRQNPFRNTQVDTRGPDFQLKTPIVRL